MNPYVTGIIIVLGHRRIALVNNIETNDPGHSVLTLSTTQPFLLIGERAVKNMERPYTPQLNNLLVWLLRFRVIF